MNNFCYGKALALLLSLYCVAPRTVLSQEADPQTLPFELPAGVRYVRDIVFRVHGADTLRLDMLLPSRSAPAPTVLFVGASDGRSRAAQLGRHAAYLASAGYVTGIIDYRPRAIGTRMPIAAAVSDAKLAVRWLRASAESYGIDRSRIGIVGAAEGAVVAALAALPGWFGVGSNDNVRFPAEVAAVALFEPLLDFADTSLSVAAQSFLNEVLTAAAPDQRRPGGLEIDVPLRVRISPVNYFGGGATRDVREHVPPFLLLHGMEDEVFPFRHSERFGTALRAHGVLAELFAAEGAGHGFFHTGDGQTGTLDALADFFARTLAADTSHAGWADVSPSWSPRGDQVVFHSNYGGEWAVWVMRTDGSRLRRVAPGREATWSPDGSRIAFESGEGRLATINSDGSGFTVLISDTAEFVHSTSWSPDGSRIAYSSWADNQLYVIRLSDGQIRRLTLPPGGNGCSSWFPDGERIAFHSLRDGQAELYVMAIDSGVTTRIMGTPQNEFCPRVSPDGRRIVFQRRTADIHEHINLFVRDLKDSTEYRLTDHPANDRWASWSPDGAWVAFTSTRTGNSDIYVIRSDGTELRRLTNR